MIDMIDMIDIIDMIDMIKSVRRCTIMNGVIFGKSSNVNVEVP